MDPPIDIKCSHDLFKAYKLQSTDTALSSCVILDLCVEQEARMNEEAAEKEAKRKEEEERKAADGEDDENTDDAKKKNEDKQEDEKEEELPSDPAELEKKLHVC